jgi:hypothetical protein
VTFYGSPPQESIIGLSRDPRPPYEELPPLPKDRLCASCRSAVRFVRPMTFGRRAFYLCTRQRCGRRFRLEFERFTRPNTVLPDLVRKIEEINGAKDGTASTLANPPPRTEPPSRPTAHGVSSPRRSLRLWGLPVVRQTTRHWRLGLLRMPRLPPRQMRRGAALVPRIAVARRPAPLHPPLGP